MERDWITETYLKIKMDREEKLARILALLRPKAEADADVKEAVRLLEGWVSETPATKVGQAMTTKIKAVR